MAYRNYRSKYPKRLPAHPSPRTISQKCAASAKPKRSLLEILVAGGVVTMTIAIVVSLFAYFHPFSWEDVTSTAKNLKEQIAAYVADFQDKKKERLAAKEKENALLETQESVPYINRTSNLGEVSDFSSESVFPTQEDSIFSCMLDTSLGPLLYYNQGDIRWKGYLYGGSDPMSSYGCGPACVAMIINSFSPASVSPVEMADWAVDNGCYAPHGGSYHCLIPDSISAFGLQVESVTDRSRENAAELLRTGHILVALMGRGTLTQNGHFIIIVQLCDNGNVYIADPANYENCTKEWDLQQLLDELKGSYDSGGPLWAVSLSIE